MSYFFRNICILIAICLGLFACGGSSNHSTPSESSNTPPSSSSSSQGSQAQVSLVSSSSSSQSASTQAFGVISWVATFTNLPTISAPSTLFQLPGDDAHWYVLRQAGIILRFNNASTANELTEVLNISDRVNATSNELGLLGAAPHPDFINNHFVFLYYTGRSINSAVETRITRYRVNDDGTFDRNSELLILSFSRPYSNHLGGQIAFDQDGYLYIASGDGGSGGDPLNMGQNLNELLGKILRIDIDHMTGGRNYAIPGDNPFVSTANARPEIWAYGLRNPWRFSFDKTTDELWVGDVGQSAWEEINVVTRGGNYGWGEMEGDFCYSERPQCSTENKIKPLYAITQNTGACSVIGGYVYRGTHYPAAYGKYFYTDYCDHRMRSITRGENNAIQHAVYDNLPTSIVSFAQDNHGELFAIGQGSSGRQIYTLQVTSQ